MLAFIFPGQGAQYRGMGEGLFDSVRQFLEAERAINDLLGYSLRTMCLQDPGNELLDTRTAQPCLYVTNALHFYAATSRGESPVLLAGHSLGEYNALLAADVFDLLTGLRIVQKRGALMAGAPRGGMMAVLGMDRARVEHLIAEEGLAELDVANFNAPMQIVLSGPTAELERARPLLERAGAPACVPLAVSGAFHSRYMRAAAVEFEGFLESVTLRPPRIPVVANVSACPYPDSARDQRALMAQQMTHPVQWESCMRYLFAQGDVELRELGPGNVLTRLTSQIRPQRRRLA